MQNNTIPVGRRVLAAFLALACVFMLISQTVPSAWAATDDERPINIQLTYVTDGDKYVTVNQDGKSATYNYPASQNTANVRMKLKIILNKDYAEDQLRIEIPYAAFKKRDGSPLNMDTDAGSTLRNQLKSSTSMLKLIEDPTPYNATTDKFVLTNKACNALQLEIDLLYKMSTWDIPDGEVQDFTVTVTDTQTNEDVSPEPLKTTFLTTVEKVTTVKQLDTHNIEEGRIYSWSDLLEGRYKLQTLNLYTPESFNEACSEYAFVSYKVSPNVITNQRFDLYLKDLPHIEKGEGESVQTINDGEVVSVAYPDPTYISCSPAEKVSGGPHDGEYVIKGLTAGYTTTCFVLVKYKLSNVSNGENIINNITATAEGLDGHEDDRPSSDGRCASQWHWASAIKPGEIWSVTKKGYKNPVAGIDLLKKGRDVTLTYDISGIGKTYKYGIVDNFKYSNGPYTLEVIDDLLYTTGLGTNGGDIERLGSDDFHFRTFTLSVKHSVVESAYPNKDVEKYHPLPQEERPTVTVYVMKASNPGVWVEDQKITNDHCYIGRYDSKDCQYYHDLTSPLDTSDENKTFKLNARDAYRIKFVYPNANGDIELKSTVTGVVKATGTTIKKVLKNLDDNKLNTFQIFNWDGANGYKKGEQMIWDNPSDGSDIQSSSEFMKEDVKIFDAENYEGHVYNEQQKLITKRLVASNTLSTLSTYAGAGKSSSYRQENGRINFTYKVGTVIGESPTEQGMRDLVEVGLIDSPKKFVFYDLLPQGVQFSKAVFNPSFYLDNANYNYDWKSGHYNREFALVNRENVPTVTTEITDNYKGTLRQMVKITLEYDELPLCTLGWTGDPTYFSYVLASGITINAIGEYADITSGNLENQMVAQVINDAGKPIEFDLENAHPDDGNVFQDTKDRNGQNAFNDVDGDGDTTSKTTFTSNVSDSINIVYTATTLIKKIRADGLDTYFKDYTQTYADHDYTYKIQFATHKGKVKNIVIFDAIEMAHRELDPNPDFWKGTLKGVDITEAKDKGFDKLKIYVNTGKAYTNKEMATDYANNNEGLRPSDLTEANGWKVVADPDNYADWAKVKTIAFSFGEDVYFGTEGELDPLGKPLNQSVSVYLKMHAPEGVNSKQTKTSQILAYNNPAYYSEVIDLEGASSHKTSYSNTVTIGVKSVQAELPAITKKITGDLPDNYSQSVGFDIVPENDNSPVLREMNNGQWGSEINSITFSTTSGRSSTTFTETRKPAFTEPTYVINDKEKVPLIDNAPYSYIITEKTGNDPHITYSKAKYKVEFAVKDTRKDVQYADDTELTVEKTIYKLADDEGTAFDEPLRVNSIEFENGYHVLPVTYKIPAVEKVVSGNDRPSEKNFRFVLRPVNQNYPMPANNAVTITGSGNAEFDEITFTEAGTYSYVVTEDYPTRNADPGYTYSNYSYSINISVVNNNGQLEIDTANTKLLYLEDKTTQTEFQPYSGNNFLFVNNYTPAPTSTVEFPTVSKVITGNDRPSEKNFTFTLRAKAGQGTIPMPEKTSVTITGKGSATFGNGITYTKAGTFIYEIFENTLSSDHTGYTRDPKIYTFTVTVTDNNGVLSAVSSLTANGTDALIAEFTNNYTPAPVEVEFPVAEKKINGNAPEDFPKNFTFELVPDSRNNPVPENRTVTVTGEGSTSFGTVRFTKAGTFAYTILENDLDSTKFRGYSKDEAQYRLTVTVTDNNGVLSAEAELLDSNEKSAEKALFVNDYTPAPASVTLPTVVKKLSGKIPEGSSKVFSFEIKLAEGGENAPMPENNIITITGEGTADFGDDLMFTEAGRYVYEISECELDSTEHRGYTRDDNVYTFVVEVTDNDGVLEIETEFTDKNGVLNAEDGQNNNDGESLDNNEPKLEDENETGDKAVFTNEYAPLPTELPIEIQKKLRGSPEKDEIYTFELTNGEKTISITITGAGKAVFDQIKYTEEGVYKYRIKEIRGADPDCIYDKKFYDITDTVFDDNGQLKVKRVITCSNGAANSVVFTNTYSNYDDGSSSGSDNPGGSNGGNNGGNNGGDSPKTGSSAALKVTPALIGIVLLLTKKKNSSEEEDQ